VLQRHREIENIKCGLWVDIIFLPRQWDKLHLRAWSWWKSELLQGYVQFDVGCDLTWYGKKVETIVRIHLQNLLDENNLEGVQKPSQKGRLQINGTCVGTPTWKCQMKVQNLNLVYSLLRKVGGSHLIEDVKHTRWNTHLIITSHEVNKIKAHPSKGIIYVWKKKTYLGKVSWIFSQPLLVNHAIP
jgi:hypothetical protein